MSNRIHSVKSIYNQEKPKKRLNKMNTTLNSLTRDSRFGVRSTSQLMTTCETFNNPDQNKLLKKNLNEFIVPQSR